MSLKSLMKCIIPEEKLRFVPSSFEVVGTIAIFNDIPKEVKAYEKKIAQTLMESHQHIQTVVKKMRKYSGRLRTPKFVFLGGKRTKETVHVENGVRLKLDVEKCYFSSRTASERARIARLVKPGESVLVMFSGVSPFPCVIAKSSRAKEVYGAELGRLAHKYALENVALNKLKNVVLFQGDVKRIVPRLKKKFNRIVLPLPKSSEKYLSLALKSLKPKGVIHLYTFARESEFSKLKEKYQKQFKRVHLVPCGAYAPRVFRVCLDLQG